VIKVGESAVSLSEMRVVEGLGADGVVELPVVADEWIVPKRKTVVLGRAVADAVANEVTVPEMRVVADHEAEGNVTGGK
jgi:hypothetical protein